MKTELRRDWAERLRGLGKQRVVKKSESVFFQGETLTTIGIIISGKAKAVFYSEDGQETWIGQFGPGDFFGHGVTLTGTNLELSIVAETKLCFLSIPVAKFETILADEQALSSDLAQDLAVRLQDMTRRLVEAVTLTSPGRVCAELVRLSKPSGVEPDKHVVRPNPVFTQLALRINSTRETVSRTVSELQKTGIISRETGAILIHQPDALRGQVK